MDNGTEAKTGEAQDSAPGLLKRWGPIIAIVAAAVIIYLNGWHEYLSLSKVAYLTESLFKKPESLAKILLRKACLMIATLF